jgi:hypothetical protein
MYRRTEAAVGWADPEGSVEDGRAVTGWRSQLRRQVAGLPYEQQVAMLRPPEQPACAALSRSGGSASVVQRQELAPEGTGELVDELVQRSPDGPIETDDAGTFIIDRFRNAFGQVITRYSWTSGAIQFSISIGSEGDHDLDIQTGTSAGSRAALPGVDPARVRDRGRERAGACRARRPGDQREVPSQ